MNIKRILLCTISLTLALQLQLAHAENPKVKMDTSKGSMIIELYPEKAPLSVANFLAYANAGAYDSTIYHRVIKDFMNQGGGFTEDFTKVKTNAPTANEAIHGPKKFKYTLAMARTGVPQSHTHQFFIHTKDHATHFYKSDAADDMQ